MIAVLKQNRNTTHPLWHNRKIKPAFRKNNRRSKHFQLITSSRMLQPAGPILRGTAALVCHCSVRNHVFSNMNNSVIPCDDRLYIMRRR